MTRKSNLFAAVPDTQRQPGARDPAESRLPASPARQRLQELHIARQAERRRLPDKDAATDDATKRKAALEARRHTLAETVERLKAPIQDFASALAADPLAPFPALATAELAQVLEQKVAIERAIAVVDAELGRLREERTQILTGIGWAEQAIRRAALDLVATDSLEAAIEAFENVAAEAGQRARRVHAIQALLRQELFDTFRQPDGSFELGLAGERLRSRVFAAVTRRIEGLGCNSAPGVFDAAIAETRAELQALISQE